MNSSNYSCLVKLASQAPPKDNTTSSITRFPTPEEMEMIRASYVPQKLEEPIIALNPIQPRRVVPQPLPRYSRYSYVDELRNIRSALRRYSPARRLIQAMSGAPHTDNTISSSPPTPTPEELTWRPISQKQEPKIIAMNPSYPRTSVPQASQTPHMDNTISSITHRPTPGEMAMMRINAERFDPPILLMDNRQPRRVVPQPQYRKSFVDKLLNLLPSPPTSKQLMRMIESQKQKPTLTIDPRQPRTSVQQSQPLNTTGAMMQAPQASQAPPKDNTTSSITRFPTLEDLEDSMQMKAKLFDPPTLLMDNRQPRTSVQQAQPRNSFGDKLRNTWSTLRQYNPVRRLQKW